LSLRDLQRQVARLVTEPALRQRFLDRPAETAEAEGWDAETARALAEIPPDRLRHFGDSLANKRAFDVSRTLPLTLRAVGEPRFFALFRELVAGSPRSAGGRIRDDAVAFAGALRGAGPRSDVPAWVADLAAFEAASIRASAPGPRLVALRLGHHPGDLVAATLGAGPHGEVRPRRTIVLWFRLGRSGRAYRACLNLGPTRRG
jgi:hypothetical protein